SNCSSVSPLVAQASLLPGSMVSACSSVSRASSYLPKSCETETHDSHVDVVFSILLVVPRDPASGITKNDVQAVRSVGGYSTRPNIYPTCAAGLNRPKGGLENRGDIPYSRSEANKSRLNRNRRQVGDTGHHSCGMLLTSVMSAISVARSVFRRCHSR